MNAAVQQLIDLLQMEQIEENLFRAQNGPGNHVFGGQVLGQAIVAASKTVENRHLHSIHAYFLRRGDRPATEPRKNTWLRCREPPPDDRTIHVSFFAYMSDLDFMAVSMQPHGPSMKGYRIQGASLDHALWFHRPFRADEWLLFSKESPVAARGRGFVRGHVFNRQGELVASASQECLIRLREREHSVAG